MKFLTITILLILHSATSFAQEACNAAYYFQQSSCQEVENKCLVLTANVDPTGKKLDYIWNMGDGNIKKGAEVEYCYSDFGGYKISLDLVNEKEGIHIKDEITKSILVGPLPEVIAEEYVLTDKATQFTFRYASPNGVRIGQVFWSFGDGTYFCGATGLHTFKSQGEFMVRVMLRGTFQGDEVLACGSTTIQVKDGNLDGHQIVDVFEQKEKELDLGKRFLEDQPHLFIYPSGSSKGASVIDIERKTHFVEVEAETQYSLFAYKGNLYVGPVDFFSGSVEMAHENLQKAVDQLFKQTVNVISPVIFETDSYSVKTREFSGLASVVKKVPAMVLQIGTYSHTGGPLDHNIELSLKRGNQIAATLQANGIAADRVKIFTAKDDSRLNNSCLGIEPCTLENPAYNSKSEIKIHVEY